MTGSLTTSRCTAPRGFTLLEVMVVVVILALLATITIPRFSGTTRREFELVTDRVADLLMMFAQRDSLGQKPVGLWYDETRRWLMLVVLDTDDSAPGREADWLTDPFVRPVKLPDVVDTDTLIVTADGEMAYIADYPLSHTPGETRPTIDIYFQSVDRMHSTTLVLEPHAVAPRRSDGSGRLQARMPVDLDAAGRSREDW